MQNMSFCKPGHVSVAQIETNTTIFSTGT